MKKETKTQPEAQGISRSDFLRGAATAGVALTLAPVLLAPRRALAQATGVRYAMVIDLRKCVGCYSCQVTCKEENDVPIGKFRSWVKYHETGSFPEVSRTFMPYLCNHCERPSCVAACPVEATYKREDGVVLIDYDKCIRCERCIAACPYDARYIHPKRDAVDKCDFCEHRVAQGLVPACVQTCMGKARFFGDLNDPSGKVARLVAANRDRIQTLLPETGNGPQVYYIPEDNKPALPNK